MQRCQRRTPIIDTPRNIHFRKRHRRAWTQTEDFSDTIFRQMVPLCPYSFRSPSIYSLAFFFLIRRHNKLCLHNPSALIWYNDEFKTKKKKNVNANYHRKSVFNNCLSSYLHNPLLPALVPSLLLSYVLVIFVDVHAPPHARLARGLVACSPAENPHPTDILTVGRLNI